MSLEPTPRASNQKDGPPRTLTRNVMLYQEHESQDEIALIEAKLGAYCVEPLSRPLLKKR